MTFAEMLSHGVPDSGLSAQDDFELWWSRTGKWVEAANQRRGGESGVQCLDLEGRMLYSKRQTGHLHRSLRYPLGRPTILREAEAYQAYSALGVRVPKVVFQGARKRNGQWQALLVTEELRGFCSLEDWYLEQAAEAGAERCHEMLNLLAANLASLHHSGWRHGCLYAKHVFVRMPQKGPAEVSLIDLEKSRRYVFRNRASRSDINQFHRHRGTMPESDWTIFLSAYQARLASLDRFRTG